jgi:hypothetical protein
MSSTFTTYVGMEIPGTNDTGWDVPIRATINTIDGLSAVGSLAVALAEHPSASLNVKVAAGSFRKSDGTIVSYAGTSSQAMTASNTNYLYLTDAGVLTVNTTGFPASTFHVRLATVVADTGTITSITDARLPWVSSGANGNTVYLALAGGTLTDGANVAVGSTTGTKIGTASTQKLGFWGATAIVQPSGSAQAAITNSTGGTASTTLSAVGATNSGDVSGTINNNLASLWNLQNAMRTAMVNAGLMKGSA